MERGSLSFLPLSVRRKGSPCLIFLETKGEKSPLVISLPWLQIEPWKGSHRWYFQRLRCGWEGGVCETRGVTETVTVGVSSDGFVGWAVCEQGRVTHTVGLREPFPTSAPACLRGMFCVGPQDS